ncbi:MAG: DUF393 domain-containing protein [Bacteroidetes bacterium]|nr:DUF393 domain-containing protein [Bacteroidota bacterium]
MDNEHVILFDGVCNLCNGLVQFIIKRDPQKKFSFASLQSMYAQQLLQKYHAGDNIDSIVYIKHEKYYTRSRAALEICRDMRRLWPLLYACIIIPPFIRDAVYDLVARKRYQLFGQRNECMIPSAETKDRFIG